MKLTKVLTEADLEDVVSVSESRGWKAVRKYVEVQKRNIAEMSLMSSSMEDLSKIQGQRLGLIGLFNYIDKDAEKELKKRRKKIDAKKV